MNIALVVAVGALFTGGAGLALVRIIRGPTLLDRMIASDVLLTTLLLVVGAEMALGGHTRTIPLMLVLAATAIFATVAVARFMAKQDDPAAATPDAVDPEVASDPVEDDGPPLQDRTVRRPEEAE